MLNKKLVLGGLVAGSFLLPMVADAGVVTGPCVNCHTMHAMQNGVSLGGPNAQLLLGTGCTTCHAHAGTNVAGTGIAGTGIPAPQVDNETTNANAGGSFTTTANTDALQHNLALVSDGVDDVLGDTPPGAAAALGAQIICQDCHGGQGGHHGTLSKVAARTGLTATNTYRQLYRGTTGVAVVAGDANYNTGDTGVLDYDTSGADTTTISGLCGTCHALFHTAANQDIGANGTWERHPTDIILPAAYQTAYNTNVTTVAELVQIPLGDNAGTNNELMCVTCHRPHGSAEPDLLRFTYANSQAGDTTIGYGCESCHGLK